MSNCVAALTIRGDGAKPGAPIGGQRPRRFTHPIASKESRLARAIQPLCRNRLSGPEGLRYAEEFVSPALEKTLIGYIAALPLQPFQFGQYEGKRRVASFGFRYDYTMRRLEEADPIPEWLGSIIEKVEAFGGRGT